MRILLALLAALPTPVLHALARPLYFLLYRILRYRRGTVRENLRFAFPQRGADEILAIEKGFYGQLSRLVLEVVRSTRMSEDEFLQRVHITNPELVREVTENWEKQAIALLIHQGNWEWMLHGAMAGLPISIDPVYKKLHSEFWDDFMLTARSRFGAEPMTLSDVGRAVIRGRRKPRLIAMLADQSGPKHGGYWTDFLNRPASFYRGAGKLALTLQLPLLFAQCRTLEAGRYEITFHELSRPPHDASEDELLERYVRSAEQLIEEQPEMYLWSNRRWKKKPPTVQGEQS